MHSFLLAHHAFARAPHSFHSLRVRPGDRVHKMERMIGSVMNVSCGCSYLIIGAPLVAVYDTARSHELQ